MKDYEEDDYEVYSEDDCYEDDLSECSSDDSDGVEYEYIDGDDCYDDDQEECEEFEYENDKDLKGGVLRGGAYSLASDYIGYVGGSKRRPPSRRRSASVGGRKRLPSGGARRPMVRRAIRRSTGGARRVRPSGSKMVRRRVSMPPGCGGARRGPSKNPWIMFLKKHRGQGYNPDQLRKMYGGARKPAKRSRSARPKARRPRKIYDYILPDDPSYQMYV